MNKDIALVGSETKTILAIETSCDETAAAVVTSDMRVLSSVVSSQIDLHSGFGGVVPEVASRAHVERILPVVAQTMIEAGVEGSDLSGVAATCGPGLIGSLLVGLSSAKALSLAWDTPFIGVNHLEGHLYGALLEEPDLEFPLVVLLVSGGHTLLVEMRGHGDYHLIGQTVDDAAGEAFDKVARYLDLGYPGGPIIDELATKGNPEAINLPRPMLHDGFNFSFSGLKTSVVNHIRKNPDVDAADVAASFQNAVVDVLLAKTQKAAEEVGANAICLAGGVAANTELRSRALSYSVETGMRCFVPSRSMCTDNAAMIGAAAWAQLRRIGPSPLSLGANPALRLV